jgi:P27 family predicted phage terminase small subunit
MTATRGRPPKPTAIKEAEGFRGKRKPKAGEPKPAKVARVPSPPAYLCAEAQKEWNRIAHQLSELGLLTELDISILALYCAAFGRWITAEKGLRAFARLEKGSGLTSQTSNGNIIQHPLVGISRRAAHDMLRYAAEFGMTPSARSRIDTERAALDADDPAAAYF